MARTTQRARTVPVRACARCPGAMSSAGVLLVDRHAEALDRGGQPARELGRLHARAVRREARAAQPGDAHAGGGLLRRRASSPRGAARRRASCGAVWATVSEPPLTKSQSMPSRAQAAPTSSTVSWAARSSAAIAASPAAARWPRAGGDLAQHPAAVAPGGAEAGHLALQDDDAQRRVGALQVVGGPQAGVAGADDADVGLAVAVERGAGGREPAEVGPPPRRSVGHPANPDTWLTRTGLQSIYVSLTYVFLICTIVPLLFGLWAQLKVKSTFKRYSQVPTASGMTGAQAAEAVLRNSGVTGVGIRPVAGQLSDHYDPRSKTLNLSEDVGRRRDGRRARRGRPRGGPRGAGRARLQADADPLDARPRGLVRLAGVDLPGLPRADPRARPAWSTSAWCSSSPSCSSSS